jgi:hypothetical protein
MSPTAIGGIVFACVFAGALGGMALGSILPDHHLSEESLDVVKLGMGLIATMSALVLGLLVASAKSSFDSQENQLKQAAAHTLMLDRVLAQYGPETGEARELLRLIVARRIEATWPEDGTLPKVLESSDIMPLVESAQKKIRELTPKDEGQRLLQ